MTTTTHPVLPQGFKRFSVEQTLLDAASLIGLRGSTLHALLHMMKRTRPDDWTDPTREPVYFGQQDATARASRLSRHFASKALPLPSSTHQSSKAQRACRSDV